MPSSKNTVATLINPQGKGRVLLVCEHASQNIPPEFNNLGLSKKAQQSHAAWDPGALAVGTHMADILDAKFVVSNISRLVYDCNRPPEAIGAMAPKSEIFDIPGNLALDDIARKDRTDRFYRPFQNLLSSTITAADIPPIIVTIHSFTPVYQGVEREVEIGILHDCDTKIADSILAIAGRYTSLNVQRNQPYGPQDGVTHTLQIHGINNGLRNVMIEIRNDLITTPDSQKEMATILSNMILDALGDIG